MQSIISKRLRNINLGNSRLDSIVFCAPMAGITDMVLRQVIRMFSISCVLISEMVSAEALKFNIKHHILDHEKNEHPLGFQICGHKPNLMAEAAKKLEPVSTFIDINMGCPAPKIVKNFDGARLMTDIKLASEIIYGVKKAVNIPVTVKCRLGWDENSKNHLAFAKMAEDSGADALIIHGRTKSQLYSGTADWISIGEVKNSVKIPVIANGDIDSPEKAKECLKISGCDGIAVARGILGDPGLIYRIENYLFNGMLEHPPDIKQRIKTALIHTKKEIEYRGETGGIYFMRKFFSHYIKNVKNAGQYRYELVRCERLSEVEKVFKDILFNI
jgi:nifR3 family TIM-barrel protein